MLLAKGIKAIFFDLDGTLRFNNPSGRDVFAEEAIRLGVPITHEDRLHAARWEHYYFAGSEEVHLDSLAFPERKAFWVNYSHRFLAALGATPDLVEKLGLRLHEYMDEHHHQRHNDILMPGVQQALQVLKKTNVILGVVSNRGEPYQEYLHEIGLAEYFDFSLSAGEAQSWKPDKGIFEHALRMVGVQPEETIYVGDNYYADVVGARNAGLKPILLDVDGIFEQPDCPVVASHQELLDLLNNIETAFQGNIEG
jgi:HAD superfamily hydrolase (TIGR01549 family)